MATTMTTRTTTTAQGMVLTSTTAPGKTFSTRAELAEHYKSDWHKYNIKRREAGLPLLRQEDFQARLEAALALRKEREDERTGTNHLKKGGKKNKDKKKKDNNNNRTKGKQQQVANGAATLVSQAAGYKKKSDENEEDEREIDNKEGKQETMDVENDNESSSAIVKEEEEEEEEPPEIDPRQSLFDSQISETVQANVDRMNLKYGFFLPDVEYLVDLEGLLGYCAEKVKLGHFCLYCQRIFRTWRGCQKHMVSTRHTKLRYERGIDMEEFDPFYDFAEANAEFLGKDSTTKGDHNMKEEDDEDSGEWEDISDNEDVDHMDVEEADDDDDEGMYAGYKEEISKYGFDVTPLGELIFPDGRIIGHRGLARYYKQKIEPNQSERAAVVAARRAAGERIYRGRVYQLRSQKNDGSQERSLALQKAGIRSGTVTGRAGNGILVPTGGGKAYTALSLYRYKAVNRKARRDEAAGRRLQHRTQTNINRMDKKANRLMNNVSVAHSKR